MLVLAGVLLVGAVCNWLVRPTLSGAAPASGSSTLPAPAPELVPAREHERVETRSWGMVSLFWLVVGVPLAWGCFTTLRQAWALLT
jgi:hypothetical protein